MEKKTFLLRSDDGNVYRISRDQLQAFKIPPEDPDYKFVATLPTAADRVAGTLGEGLMLGTSTRSVD
jgi:hypothetical protein